MWPDTATGRGRQIALLDPEMPHLFIFTFSLSHSRCSYVCIAMEALDQLLMACHCQSINLFVESFLKMVRKLLEADKPNLQILGTNSVSVVYAV